MEGYFVLNERGEPMLERDVEAWTRWFERADRSVARKCAREGVGRRGEVEREVEPPQHRREPVDQVLGDPVDQERRRKVGELIADGYRRIPQEEDELEAARRAAIRSIEQEPW